MVSTVQIASGGPILSRLVYGVWRMAEWGLTPAEIRDMVEMLLEMGVTTFDHADIYGDYSCEQLFGEALAGDKVLRQKMQLVTKCGIKLVSANRPEHKLKYYDTTHNHIISSVETSLRNLKTETIDLLLIHRPDPLMNPDEVAGAFDELRQAGKVQFFGVSNFSAAQFELLASRLDFPLVTNQIELSAMDMTALHDGTVDHCLRRGVSPMAWSPFAGGRLFASDTPQAVRLRRVLGQIGDRLGGAAIDQVALAWLLYHPARILPVLGTGKVERVKTAIQSESLNLTREDWFEIWSASTGTEVP
jgi:predicted oxidoreductase